MNPRLRHVRHLRFTVRREDDAQLGRTLMEDALETASLGDDGRVFVVRSLDLGKLSLRSGSIGWSMRIEERMRRLRSSAVSIDERSANAAEVVYFEGPLEPWLKLAVRVICNQPVSDWYWRATLPGWSSSLNSAETLRLAFVRLAEHGAAASYVLAKRLQTVDALPQLVEALRLEDVAPIFPAQAADVASSSRAQSSPQGQRPQPGEQMDSRRADPLLPSRVSQNVRRAEHTRVDSQLVTDRALPPLAGWVQEKILLWGETDPRSVWLVAALTLSTSTGVSRPEAELREIVHALAVAGNTGVYGKPSPREASWPSTKGIDRIEVETEAVTESKKSVERIATGCGGLFFLVPLLTRTGFGASLLHEQTWLDGGMAWKLLHLALRHAKPAADEQLGVLLPRPSDTLPKDVAWRALLRAHRLGRKLTGMPLRELIVRPAEIAVNETHVDVFFRPSQADIRVRRAGLDLDPGWVGWLGRVVTLYYTLED